MDARGLLSDLSRQVLKILNAGGINNSHFFGLHITLQNKINQIYFGELLAIFKQVKWFWGFVQ